MGIVTNLKVEGLKIALENLDVKELVDLIESTT